MFKTSNNSEISKSKFGVGSIIKDGFTKYLVVTVGDDQKVFSVNMSNFCVNGKFIHVGDINHFTQEECRALCDTVNSRNTFSDFELLPEGLKQ